MNITIEQSISDKNEAFMTLTVGSSLIYNELIMKRINFKFQGLKNNKHYCPVILNMQSLIS